MATYICSWSAAMYFTEPLTWMLLHRYLGFYWSLILAGLFATCRSWLDMYVSTWYETLQSYVYSYVSGILMHLWLRGMLMLLWLRATVVGYVMLLSARLVRVGAFAPMVDAFVFSTSGLDESLLQYTMTTSSSSSHADSPLIL